MSFDINYIDEEAIVEMVTSPFFYQKINERTVNLFEGKVLEMMGFEDKTPQELFPYGLFSQHYRVACGNFRTRQINARSIRSAGDAEKYIEALALEAVQNTFPLLEAIKKAGGLASLGWPQAAVEIRWKPWNVYDAICNPEALKPYWKMRIKITWHHPDDLVS